MYDYLYKSISKDPMLKQLYNRKNKDNKKLPVQFSFSVCFIQTLNLDHCELWLHFVCQVGKPALLKKSKKSSFREYKKLMIFRKVK